MPQLPIDCLNEIFEYLKDDKVSLHSCLLVNHLWCEVSVRILWRDVCKYNKSYDTLISCLPNESKEILSKNELLFKLQNLQCLIMQDFAKLYQLLWFIIRLKNILKFIHR